jgi:hypothetical protein
MELLLLMPMAMRFEEESCCERGRKGWVDLCCWFGASGWSLIHLINRVGDAGRI